MELKQLKDAINKLSEMLDEYNKKEILPSLKLKEAVTESLLQRFEYTVDVSWKIAKRYLKEYQGFNDQTEMGPKPVLRLCGELGLLNSEKWLNFLEDRNSISHDYSGAKASIVIESVPLFFKEVNLFYKLLEEKTGSK